MMNKRISTFGGIALTFAIVCLQSCTDDTLINNGNGTSGYEIVFGAELTDHAPGSRTVYDENAKNDPGALNWPIYWLGEKDGPRDTIFIYSPQGMNDYKSAAYVIHPATSGEQLATNIVKVKDPIKTGSNDKHDFYAIYPASAGGSGLTGGPFKGSLPQYQTVQYAGTKLSPGVSAVPNEPIANAEYLTNPDMSACIMIAEKKGIEVYTSPVNLVFEPFATVLDITVQGPRDKNTITQSGDCGIITVEITANAPIAGSFTISQDAEGNSVYSYSGSKTITVATTGYDADGNIVGIPMEGSNTLRVQAFMLPNPDVTEISVKVINTDAQSWTKKLTVNKDIFKPRQVHKVTLPKLNLNEATLEYHRWMEQLDPRIYISELSIPGSLHSFAGYKKGASNLQSLTIEEQFNAGIRAFRFAVTEKGGTDPYNAAMTIIDDQKTYQAAGSGNSNYGNPFHLVVAHETNEFIPLSQALAELHKLLDGPARNEFIIVSLGSYLNAAGWGIGTMSQYQYHRYYKMLEQIALYMYNQNILVGPDEISTATTLGDVRGKILLNVEAWFGYLSNDNTVGDVTSFNNNMGFLRTLSNATGLNGLAPIAWTATSQLNRKEACYSPISYGSPGSTSVNNYAPYSNPKWSATNIGADNIIGFALQRVQNTMVGKTASVILTNPDQYHTSVPISDIKTMTNYSLYKGLWLCSGDAHKDASMSRGSITWTGRDRCIQMIKDIGAELESRYSALTNKPLNTLFVSILGCESESEENVNAITIESSDAWNGTLQKKQQVPYGIVVMPQVTLPDATGRSASEAATAANIQKIISHNNDIHFRLARKLGSSLK